MMWNYLKITLRYLLRHRMFTALNVTGLALGLAVTLFITLFVMNELSYERLHEKAERIFRVTMHIEAGNYDTHWARVNRDMVNNLPEEFPEIEALIRFQNFHPRNIRVGTDTYKLEHAYSVDGEVFEVFDFELLRGNPETALKDPNAVVLTEQIAQRFFAGTDPMGQVIEIHDLYGAGKQTYRVTGVMKNLPGNTHLPVNLLTSFASEEERTGWAYTYLLLGDAGQLTAVERKLPAFIDKYSEEEAEVKVSFPLQPIETIHLHSNLARELSMNGKRSHLYLFGGVGLFILLMSAINFINLNAAQSLSRLKEIGIRKVLGSSRSRLTQYFLLESTLITLMAMILALGTVVVALPFMQEFASIAIPVVAIVPVALVITGMVAVLAAYYPAFVLTRRNMILALKNKEGLKPGKGKWSVKHVLVALQLTLCIGLISSSLITRSQFEYLVNKNLGLEKERVLAITAVPDPVKLKYDILKNELLQLPGVLAVAGSMEVPSRAVRDSGPIYAEGMTTDEADPPVMDIQVVDGDFIQVMGIEMAAGENFSNGNKKYPGSGEQEDLFAYLQNEPREYILNETAVQMVGWSDPGEAIGKQFSWSIGGIQLQRGPVVGVVKDFHQETLRNKIDPIVMVAEPIWIGNVLIKMKSDNMRTAVSEVEGIWAGLFPQYPMDYAFVDDLYNRLYQSERQQLQLIYLFTGLAIFIAFLGIFGLLSYAVKTREKEIAIRKVLGAGLPTIALLLSRSFLVFTGVGILIAVPLTWLAMNRWLENFVYRINLSVLDFFVAGVLVLGVLLLTIVLQMRKVAASNPVDQLRSE